MKKVPINQVQNIKVAVDNCIFTIIENRLNILMIQMKKKPFTDLWALPGGLVENIETLDDAAKRILTEQTGVNDIYLEQLYTFSRTDRDPSGRVVSSAYFALIPPGIFELRTSEKYAKVKWCEAFNHPTLAYDHNEIVDYAIKRLQWKLEYTNVAWSLLNKEFNISELQKVYEAVIGREFDRRNFRKKIMSLDIIESVGIKVMRGAHRPAMLYRFKQREAKIINFL